MREKDAFAAYHPAVLFADFTVQIVFSSILAHPGCLALSLAGAGCYAARVCGGRRLRAMARFLIPAALLVAWINPAFSHRGVTVLAVFPSGNPLTLESIGYGLGAACRFAAVFLWFAAVSSVMTTDKWICLFGHVLPALSLLLSMTLRFVPRFKAHLDTVRAVQSVRENGRPEKGLLRRVRLAFSAFFATVTWALENAIDTADSMKSRGYGLKGRTAFSVFRFTERDRNLLIWLCFCGVYLLCGHQTGAWNWRWYPAVHGAPVSPFACSLFAVYAVFCVTPSVTAEREDRKWKALRRSI